MSRTEENRKYIDKKKALGFTRYYFMLKANEAHLIRQVVRNLDIREKIFHAMEKNIAGLTKTKKQEDIQAVVNELLHGSNSTAQYQEHSPSVAQSELGGSYVQ